jgi:hypothetical protein
MTRSRKRPDLSVVARPFWASEHHPEVCSDLVYLAWGLRNYSQWPNRPPPQRAWSYMVVLQGTPTIVFRDGPLRIGINARIDEQPPTQGINPRVPVIRMARGVVLPPQNLKPGFIPSWLLAGNLWT